ncbi:hypothetical protein [Collinsella tanakaei]|uniref:hypothetical protein n=1 Tax=Collinsella tanakaei TaxID=626935 RepID=UPI0039F49966
MMEIFGMISFALLIYLICTVPTKKDLKRLLEPPNYSRANKYRSALRSHIGTRCTVTLTDATVATGGIRVTGTLHDMDDEWALFEVEQKKGSARLTAVRLDSIEFLDWK